MMVDEKDMLVGGSESSPPPSSSQQPSMSQDDIEREMRGQDPNEKDIGSGAAIQRALVAGAPGGRPLAAAADTYLPTWASGSPEATGNYAQNYARIGKQLEEGRRQYPWTTFVATAAPAVASSVVAPEATFGRALASGIGWGAATGANEGNDPADVAKQGLWGGIAGGLGAGVLYPAASLITPYATKARQVLLDAAKNINVTLPRFAASSYPLVQWAGSLGKSAPLTNAPLNASTHASLDQMGEAATDLAGGTSPRQAGVKMKEAMTNWVGPITDNVVESRYNAASAMMDQTIRTPPSKVQDAMGQILASKGSFGKTPKGDAIDTVMGALSVPGGLTYEGMKNLKAELGGMKTWGSALPGDLSSKDITKLWAAARDDLDAAATNAGGPAAQEAHKFANDFYAETQAKRKQLSTLLGGDKSDGSPESVFENLANTAKKNGGDLDLLRQAKDVVSPQDWQALSQGMVSRLGRQADGTLTPDRFLSDYGNISPEAKDEVFGASVAGSTLRNSLDSLQTVSKRYKDLKIFANTSGTSHMVGAVAIGEHAPEMVSGLKEDPVGMTLKIAAGIAAGSGLGHWLAQPATAGATATMAEKILGFQIAPSDETYQAIKYAAARMAASASAQYGKKVAPLAIMAAVNHFLPGEKEPHPGTNLNYNPVTE